MYELNFPELEPILQRVDALASELDYEAARNGISRIIAAIREGTTRTTEIVRSLQQFAHPDGSEKAPADIHVGLDSTLMLLENRFKKGITVHKDYGDIPHVEGFAGQLNQVFLNLLSNAADAMNDKGEIWIVTRKIGEVVEIRTKDTGCGISDEIRDKIFDPFFTTKKVGSGMGLGLWICYQIVVDGHGGWIEVHSEIGKGTEMIIKLPIKAG